MKSVLFAYYDKQIGVYSSPITFQGAVEDLKETIIRAVKGEKLRMDNIDVIDLYLLGEFEDKDGSIISVKPQFLLSLCEYLPVKVAQDLTKGVTENGKGDHA